jgi:hypothetical protein
MIYFRRAHPILSKEQFYMAPIYIGLTRKEECPTGLTPKEKQFGCLIHEDEQRALS